MDGTRSVGKLEGLRFLPSPNFNARPDGEVVNLLVIHNISLPPGEFGNHYIDQLFCNELDSTAHPSFERLNLKDLKVSAHFLIDRTGTVTQYVPITERAWHAGVSKWNGRENCGDFSIGIELEGTDEIPYTDAQYLELALLTKRLIQYFPAISIDRIVGHSDIAPERKSDPGTAFDWPRYRALLY